MPTTRKYMTIISSAPPSIKERILQVIQRKPNSEHPALRARKQIWDGNTICWCFTLELSDAIKPALKKIIKAWLVDGTPFEDIRLYCLNLWGGLQKYVRCLL